MTTEKADLAIARADRVMRALDERDGAARAAARRERQRLNAGLGRAFGRAGIAILMISMVTILIGVLRPIGMFGFLAAVGLAIGAAVLMFASGRREIVAPNVSADLPNGQMVQRFDSYLFRSRRLLPAPAQAEIDLLSAQLPPLRQTLERVPDLEPSAQDARRLMSTHLPGLIDRYLHVPGNYRGERDGEGISVDERLVEALAAGRQALTEISEKLARSDLAAFETQGRFIKSRYGEETLTGAVPPEER
jgi:hypothetical protein